MIYQFATLDEVAQLASMNRQLAEDEGHRHATMPVDWFAVRIRALLQDGYAAVLFEREGTIVGYAMYADHPDHGDTIYLRHLFVCRDHRRQGIGREAMRILFDEIWPPGKRLTVEVLVTNERARGFFDAIGYHLYSVELEVRAGDRRSMQS